MPSLVPDWIAKDCLDVGLYTNQLDAMLAYWQTSVGLSFDHMLPVGGGVRQHRHDFETAVLKLNHSRHPLDPPSKGGHRRLIIGKTNLGSPQDLVDPDGNDIRLVPKREDGIAHWAIEVATKSEDAFFQHYHAALGLPKDDRFPIAVSCGRSLIIGIVDADIADLTDGAEMKRTGFRYTTIQVSKVDSVHEKAVRAGAIEAAPPQTLGETARVSFLKDTHGNWMELSQRASITGSLAPG